MAEIVETKNLTKVYKLGKVEVPALRGINLRVQQGEFLSVMGPSGCGKTTLLNMIGALDRPTDGQVIIDGTDVTKLSENKLALLRCEKIGFVFQFYNLIPTLTALENVELPMTFANIPKKEREKRAAELLELVGLKGRLNHKPDELSGGEQQRVTIARALANKPAIILADEPTGDLDTKTGTEIIKLIKELNQKYGQTVIIVTHAEYIAKNSDRIVYLKDGLVDREVYLTQRFKS
ncbi:MAG: ABC transporter ATP-binding protein [Euryarchaeota archaeon]|nr:ABC transporter ATP-binding protein [Euryarchaeota archaeon]